MLSRGEPQRIERTVTDLITPLMEKSDAVWTKLSEREWFLTLTVLDKVTNTKTERKIVLERHPTEQNAVVVTRVLINDANLGEAGSLLVFGPENTPEGLAKKKKDDERTVVRDQLSDSLYKGTEAWRAADAAEKNALPRRAKE